VYRGHLDETRLRALIEVGRGLVAQLDLEAVLRQVVEVARDQTGARYAALGVLDEERRELERFIYVGIDEQTRARIGALPLGRGVLGELIRDPAPLRLRDIGEHPRSYGFPPGHPPMRSFLGVPIMVRGQAYGNLYLSEAPEGEFSEADEEAVTILSEWAGIAIFNTRMHAQADEERSTLERAVHALEATTEIARAVGGETQRERVLETVAKRTRALIGCRSLLVLLRYGSRVEVAAAAGECGSAPVGRQLEYEPALDPADPERTLRVLAPLGLEARAAELAPLEFRGRRLGSLVAFDRIEEGPEFFAEDRRLLGAAAASAATAVSTIESVTEERLRHSLITAERERGHWARELHDGVLQSLGARRLLLASALKKGGVGLGQAVRTTLEAIDGDIEELRALITELRPATLDQLGLTAALEDLGHRIGGGNDVQVEVELQGALDHLGPEVETVVYRLAQEALTNVAKHSRATHAELDVSAGPERVELTVADDGIGFDPEDEHEGFGVAGMRERVELAGGELEIESEQGAGSRVTASIPLVVSAGQ
jgi:signal transduction histidine kinase